MDSLKEIIESILFVAGEPVDFADIADKLDLDINLVIDAAKELQKDKQDSFSGIQIQIFNNKAQLCSNPNYIEKVTEVLNPIKEKALTKAVLEAAAIVAYKQPITRLEIEQVRGVNSDYAVNILIENHLIEVVGRKDALGKPLLFGTTDTFLKRFNLESLDQLPDYDELLDRIKVIKNPESSLFDFSNIPDSTKPVNDENTEESIEEETTSKQLDESNEVVEDIESKSGVDNTTQTDFDNTVQDEEIAENKANIEENEKSLQSDYEEIKSNLEEKEQILQSNDFVIENDDSDLFDLL